MFTRKTITVDAIQEFILNHVKDNTQTDCWWSWLNVEDGNGKPYMIMLDWIDGYDESDENLLRHPALAKSYGLECSFRYDEDNMFANDNPYVEGYTFTIYKDSKEDDFKTLAQMIYDSLMEIL